MTNRIAIILGLMVVAALAFDTVYYDNAGILFLGRKLVVYIEYLAFWR